MAVQDGLHEGRSGPGASHNEHRWCPNDRLEADRSQDRLLSRAAEGVIADFCRSAETRFGATAAHEGKMSPTFPSSRSGSYSRG